MHREAFMGDWMRKIVAALAGVVIVAVMVRVAWELLRPTLPAVIVLLVAVAVLSVVIRRLKGW